MAPQELQHLSLCQSVCLSPLTLPSFSVLHPTPFSFLFFSLFLSVSQFIDLRGLPWWLRVKNPPAIQEAKETRVRSLGQEGPLKKGTATHSSILAWRSHRQRSLVGYSPWGRKEPNVTEQLSRQTQVINDKATKM